MDQFTQTHDPPLFLAQSNLLIQNTELKSIMLDCACLRKGDGLRHRNPPINSIYSTCILNISKSLSFVFVLVFPSLD